MWLRWMLLKRVHYKIDLRSVLIPSLGTGWQQSSGWKQLSACFFSLHLSTTSVTLCHLFKYTHTTKTQTVLFTYSRNVTKLCRPFCNYVLQEIIISTCWCVQGQGQSWFMREITNQTKHIGYSSSLLFDISSLLDPLLEPEVVLVRHLEGRLWFLLWGVLSKYTQQQPSQSLLTADTPPPCWISVIDWTLQPIGLIWYITMSLEFQDECEDKLNSSVSLLRLLVWTTKRPQTTFLIY